MQAVPFFLFGYFLPGVFTSLIPPEVLVLRLSDNGFLWCLAGSLSGYPRVENVFGGFFACGFWMSMCDVVFREVFALVLFGVTTENTEYTEFHGKNTKYRRFAAYGIHGKNLSTGIWRQYLPVAMCAGLFCGGFAWSNHGISRKG
ncbi:MAG: hypothetical protein O0V67_02490 [Methanocorpusculum sp.]|nr:hypothetical protein [Methanocorpusculum sp.]